MLTASGCLARRLRLWNQLDPPPVGPAERLSEGVVDAGAHLGNHTVYFALVSDAIVHAFEPNPVTARYLRGNVERNGLDGQVFVYEKALGARPATAAASSRGSSGQSSGQ
jgi:FkbM family methyltransferase